MIFRYAPGVSNTVYLRGFYSRLSAADVDAMAVAARVGLPPHVALEPGRNDPCPCRSGAKFKRCCGA